MTKRLEMTAFITAKEGMASELSKEIQKCVLKTVEEPGCIEFKVFQTEDNPHRFILWEIFENREAIEYHMAQVHTKEYFACGFIESTEVIKTTQI